MGPSAPTGRWLPCSVAGRHGVAPLVLLLALAAHAGAAPAPAPQPRIVNGTFTSAFPSAVAVLEGGDPATAITECTGTLIGCRTVVTAAHCVCGEDVRGAACTPDPRAHTVFMQHAGFFSVGAVTVHPDYVFPVADLALLRLAVPVNGVAPSPLVGVPPPIGAAGTVVGFGRAGGVSQDYGLKRVGSVALTDCASRGLPNDATLCFAYDGPPGANTCNGDSGGPLYVDGGGSLALAGVTSGGTLEDCVEGDESWDTSVAHYASWIAEHAKDALGVATCGDGPQAGEAGTTVVGITGALGGTVVGSSHQIDVPSGTARLRVTLNAEEGASSLADFDLLVAAGREPSEGDADCSAVQSNQYGACDIADPVSGPWHVRVVRASGGGRYQVTATVFGAASGAGQCGNGTREPGEACDGADAGPCPAGCTVACACAEPPPCAGSRVVVRRLGTRRRLVVSARLLDDRRELAGLDPTRSDLALVLDDDATQVQVSIPAGDGGWRRSPRARGAWRWRGNLDGVRSVRLRDRSVRDGVWIIRLRGRASTGTRALDRQRARLVLSVGGRCVTE